VTYREIGLGRIQRNPDQPRKHFDHEALQELAGSLRANGLLEPIVVRPAPGKPKGWWLIIAGERRWRAAKLAGLPTVPCRILEVDEPTAFELSVAENVNRHDMNPMEEAQAYATLQGYGRDVTAIATLFGKTTRYISMRLELLQLTEEFADQVIAGRISPGVAQQTARLNAGNQQAMLFRLMKGEFANDNEAIHFAYALGQAEQQTSMFDVDEPDPAQRAARTQARKRVRSLVDRLDGLADGLSELAGMTPEEFADAHAGDTKVTLAKLERIHRLISKARFNARQGAAVEGARQVISGTG
jgi:ParB family chromosome partitioning protein